MAQDSLPAFETLLPVCARKALIFSHHLDGNSAAPQWDSHSTQMPYHRIDGDHAAGLNRFDSDIPSFWNFLQMVSMVTYMSIF